LPQRTELEQPGRPGVAQVMPAEIAYSSTDQGASPGAGVGPVDRLSLVGEDAFLMLSALALQDVDCDVVERHMQVVAVRGIVTMNPGSPPSQIDLRPEQAG